MGNVHYYRQAIIDEVVPLIAPNIGHGVIYVIGRGFRDDFENAKLSCRVGNTIAKAILIDVNTIRCTLDHELPLVDAGESLLVSVALNSYSWISSDFSMVPYGITGMYPTMGPVGQSSQVMVTGKGFENDLRENARCRFGTDGHYVIVEATVLDNEHLVCRSPSDQFSLPQGSDQQISIPFSIAFQEDLYFPYTESGEKFRLYIQPNLIEVFPKEIHVDKVTQIFITAHEDGSFW